MKVIKPLEITDSNMTSTIAEPDPLQGEVEWSDPRVVSAFGLVTGTYYASVTYTDGIIYAIGNSGEVLEIDTLLNNTSTFGSVSLGYRAMAVAPNGNIYCVGTSGVVLEIDPVLKTTLEFGSVGSSYRTAVLGLDGNIYCVGYTSGIILEINPVTKSTSTFGSVQPYYRGGVEANNGRLYFVGSEGYILDLNVISKSTFEFASGSIGSYYGCALGGDGLIYAVGVSGVVLLIDPFDNSYSEFGAVAGAYYSISLSTDGYMYCMGDTGTKILEIDALKKEVAYFGITNTPIYTTTVAQNGDIYGVGGTNEIQVVNRKYLVGEELVSKSTHRKYRAAEVTDDDPEIGANLEVPSWVDIGATNKFACFDESVSSASIGASPLVIEITPGELFDSIVGLNITGATSINVMVTDPVEGVVYNHDINMVDNSEVVSWSTYLWNGFVTSTTFALLDLPLYRNGTIKVTFTGAGDVSVGTLVAGHATVLGEANFGSSVQQLSFNRVEEDDFGNVTIIKRPSAKLVNYDVTVNRDNLGYVYKQLEALDGINAVWLGTDDTNDLTIVYGYHRDNNIGIDTPTLCKVTIQVRGLI